MRNKIIKVALLGKNHPGFISSFTKIIYDQGANIEKSKMVAYGDQFLINLQVNTPKSFDTKIFDYTYFDNVKPKNTTTFKKIDSYDVNLAMNLADTPGIIHNTAKIFAEYNCNINKLSSDTELSAFSNIPLFKLDMTVSVPKVVTINEIEEQISENQFISGVTVLKKINT